MKKFYIEKKDKPKLVFRKMKIENDNCEIYINLEKEKNIRKVIERLIKNEVTNVVLSKELINNKELINALNAYDIKVIDALHQPFDHNTMEAVMTEEVEGIEPNMVIDVLQKGYTYKGKVIRYAMVKVSK